MIKTPLYSSSSIYSINLNNFKCPLLWGRLTANFKIRGIRVPSRLKNTPQRAAMIDSV